eukprot:TRINITY_DN1359_c0_g1_i1.p1 TRINITY_DN1359_c0_g1~~TRINITY_DN1359_c0_g1_i1.p1  ORF type:complete len:616 (-),score=134.38 TRINITY_DN1359_c0_g1_i1:96-1943(-)
MGNHDVFTLTNRHDHRNKGPKYTVTGNEVTADVFERVYRARYGSYRVVVFNAMWGGSGFQLAVDGPTTRHIVHKLRQTLLNDVDPVTGARYNHTLLACHFPTQVVGSTPPQTIQSLLLNGKERLFTAWLCGHQHMTGYLRHRYSNFIELALADLRDTKAYRVFAIDNDLFSFRDVKLDEWPVVVVTNPKDAAFLAPQDNVASIRTSTHIRCLIFSPDPIKSAIVEIGHFHCNLTHAESAAPLFTCPWDSSAYAHGVHSLNVKAVDTAGRTATLTQDFSLDGTIVRLPTYAYTQASAVAVAYAWYVCAMLYTMCYLLVLPCLFGWLYRAWTRSKRHWFARLDAVIGPISIAWLNEIEHNRTTFANYVDTMKLRVWEQALTLFTWRFRSTMAQFSQTPTRYVVFLALCGLFSAGAPAFFCNIGPHPWGAVFYWATVIDSRVVPFAFGYLYGGFFYVSMFYPAVVVLNGQTRPGNRAFPALKPCPSNFRGWLTLVLTAIRAVLPLWELLHLLVQVSAAVGAVLLLWLAYNAACVFLSPGMLWVTVVLLAAELRLVLLRFNPQRPRTCRLAWAVLRADWCRLPKKQKDSDDAKHAVEMTEDAAERNTAISPVPVDGGVA